MPIFRSMTVGLRFVTALTAHATATGQVPQELDETDVLTIPVGRRDRAELHVEAPKRLLDRTQADYAS